MIMKLKDLIKGISRNEVVAEEDLEITGIAHDSRQVKPGYLFVAMKGEITDGNAYVEDAVAAGAVVVLSEQSLPNGLNCGWIQTVNAREALARIAKRWYDSPDEKLLLAGVTGTNGKTSVAYLMRNVLEKEAGPTGFIGTTGYSTPLGESKASLTTPEALQIEALLAEMIENGCRSAVMEASSVAVDRHRVTALDFDVMVFTNLSQDHLDYHSDMESYYQAKRKLFFKRDGYEPMAVINRDDSWGKRLIEETDLSVLTFGADDAADVYPSDIKLSLEATELDVNYLDCRYHVSSRLLGRVNVENILAAFSAGVALRFEPGMVASSLSKTSCVPGRLEIVPGSQPFTVLVDYAHTDDALLRLLLTANELARGRVIVIFGCGGDRDRGKRPLMGRHAVSHSDMAILTSDNPRSEDPMKIIADVEQGIKNVAAPRAEHLTIPDRSEAIAKGISLAKVGDIVLIAGKGHEDYQIIGKERRHFSDREVAAKVLAGL